MIHHLAFRTRDLARLEAFYAGLLGLPVVRRTERSVWLDLDGTLLMLERAEPEETLPSRSMELVALRATSALRERTRSLEVEARTDYSLYFRDPDGRRIGLSSYPDVLA